MDCLRKIKLKNFKSIQQLDLKLTNLNVMIGANGAGKSNFVNFFKMLEAIGGERLQEYSGRHGGFPGFFFYGNNSYGIDCELYLEFGGEKIQYAFILKQNDSGELFFVEEKVIFEEKSYSLGAGHRESRLYSDAGNKVRNKLCRRIGDLLKTWQVFQFHETSKMRAPRYIHDNLSLLADGANLAPYLLVIKQRSPQTYRRIVRTIQLIIPYFKDFELEPLRLNQEQNRLDWHELSSNMRFSSTHFSDGSLRFAALATLLLQPVEMLPHLILIDEPELGLHPAAVRLLAAMINAASGNTQIILATQSKTLVDEFKPEDIVVLERIIDREDRFRSEFRRLDTESLGQWLEKYKLGDIWDKDIFGGRP